MLVFVLAEKYPEISNDSFVLILSDFAMHIRSSLMSITLHVMILKRKPTF